MNNKVRRMAAGFLAAAVVTTSMGVTAFAGEANTQTAPKAAQQTTQTQNAESVKQNDQTYNQKQENIKNFQTRINNQTDAAKKKDLNQRFEAYQSKVTATENAKKALVTELSKYNIKTNSDSINIVQVETAIKKLNNPVAQEKLSKLLAAYKNAVAAEQAAKTAMDTAFDKVDTKANSK